jgi:anti-anti-sigma regulatory factor
MINVNRDAEHNAVIVEFAGNVDAAQAERSFAQLEKLLPKGGQGFKLLVDFSSVETMEPEVEVEVTKAMDLLNERGVREIVRVLPDPDSDFGFDILSTRHYSKQVQIHTVRSRDAGNSWL